MERQILFKATLLKISTIKEFDQHNEMIEQIFEERVGINQAKTGDF